ncbi:MAG: L-histidine N(alpha)-methyltransferase [Caulobacteraceae bacterium]
MMLDVLSVPRDARLEFHDYSPDLGDFREALLRGLAGRDKSIPCRFLYDARGSALFDRICELPASYPTRTELGILRACAAEIAERAGPAAQMIELGGVNSLKARILLDALEEPAAYIPIDISREHLKASVQALGVERPELEVLAVCADYTRPLTLPDAPGGGMKLGFFPGSTIGNLQPDEATLFLAAWARRLGPGSAMVVGVDLRKDAAILEPAYDDAQGVTAAFSKNLLARANRELGADFDVAAFAHRARYDVAHGRIEIHLESLKRQTVHVGAVPIAFGEGERIHVEDSYKYSLDGFRGIARAAGFRPAAVWTDPLNLFSVHWLETAGD